MLKYNSFSEVQAELLKISIIDLTGEVDDAMALYLREAIIRLTAKGSPDIEVKITSNGGRVDYGLDIYDMLRLYPGKKTGVILGMARSMGIVMLQACDIRKCAKHARVMIHHVGKNHVSLDTLRSKSRLKKFHAEMEKDQTKLYEIICAKTGKDRKVILKICAEDRDMSADEAKKLGLIDEII